jgi:hypothetical protein
MFTVARSVTVRPTQMGTAFRTAGAQEVVVLMTVRVELTGVGARVIAADKPALTMAETLAAADAVASPPLVGRTPALRVTVAIFPKPKVMQASRAAPEHDLEVAEIVLPEMTIGVGSRAGAVIIGTDAESEALAMLETPAPTEAVATPPVVGRTPASRVTVAIFPKPKVMQASRAAPEHDLEVAEIVLPEMTIGVGSRAGRVTSAEATGADAVAPTLMTPPVAGRASAPRLTVARGPSPRLMHTLRTPLPEQDCSMAVMVCPPGRTEIVGMIVVLVSAGVETGALTPRETMLPSVFRAPRVTVVEGPTPSAKQSTLSQDAIVVVITSPPGRVVGTLGAVMTGMRPPAPTLMRLPSAFRAPRVMVAEGPTLSPRQTTPSHDEVVPVLGIPVIIGVNGRPLVIGPTTLVMDAIALDCCDRIEEMEAVASL